MFNIDKIITKWEITGLLEGLPQNLKARLALKYELVAHCVMDNDIYFENNFLHTSIFVIIYRIYRSGKKIGDVETFVREVYEFYINNHETMQVHDVDMDEEMAILFVKQYKGADYGIFKPVKWVAKHKL